MTSTLVGPLRRLSSRLLSENAISFIATDRSFALRLVEGAYRFSMSGLPAGVVVKSIRHGLEELSNQTLSVGPGKDPAHLIVTIGRASNP
jgi:hypothetical protein